MNQRAAIVTSPATGALAPVLFPGDLLGAARAAAELGFEGMELSIKGPEELSERELGILLNHYGLELAAIASGRIYLDEKATLSDPEPEARLRVVERLTRLIDLAATFGAPVIVGLLEADCLIEGDRSKTTQALVTSMQQVAEHACRRGIDVLLEAINRYETPLLNTAAQAIDVVHRVGSPNVKVLLDVFHMNIEELSIAEAIRSAGDRLGHLHVADSNRLAPGMGHVDFAEIAAALGDIGYQGWVSGEHLPLPDSFAAAKQTRSFMLKL